MNPTDRKYSREHEWVQIDSNGLAVLGITEYAQDQLGDIVFLDLPPIGTRVEQFQKFGEIESVKAVSDLFAPLSGEVVEINSDAQDYPELVNRDPYGEGWLMKLKVSNPTQLNNLMSRDEYEAYIKAKD